jgi:hypothetical protein
MTVDGLALRCYRARSWMRRASDPGSAMDLDGRFIFLWIAFNALYGQAKSQGHCRELLLLHTNVVG